MIALMTIATLTALIGAGYAMAIWCDGVSQIRIDAAYGTRTTTKHGAIMTKFTQNGGRI
ncbi:hypothetical protein [Marivivens niveibacter]|uniref:hypothetical protein n=1 Tax=Marivivens niveibacter TaxID=1930667 RepID=UPI0013FDE767|nr:hypothetical protein [Marivivens niveibacter]